MAELVGAHNMVQRVTMFILLVGPVYLYYPREASSMASLVNSIAFNLVPASFK